MKAYSRLIATLLCILLSQLLFAQEQKKILFVGNSYTYSNNMPQILADIAEAMGNEVISDSHTPGGYHFYDHAEDQDCLDKIEQGDWDFVSLQEQSQIPSFPDADVEEYVYPYAQILCEQVTESNPCAEILFFMTWGRENGDSSNCPIWPPVCTYEGMDDLLQERYVAMMDANDKTILSPVGKVWRHIRETYPEINLYSPDESHPSFAGSYMIACTFYTAMFRQNPEDITYDATLDATVASHIREAVKTIVYDNFPQWKIGAFDPIAGFESVQNENEVTFTNTSENATGYLWDFGDGASSELENPVHTYQQGGEYQVTLTATHCARQDELIQSVSMTLGKADHYGSTIVLYPNPAEDFIYIDNLADADTIYLTDLSGKGLALKPQGLGYDISQLQAGLYILHVVSGHQTTDIKLMIQ